MTSVNLLPEPKLTFGKGKLCADPKLGLLSYGPSGVDFDEGKYRIVRAGAIGTYPAIGELKNFLLRLSSSISAQTRYGDQPWKLDFPGLGKNGPLGYDIVLDESAVEFISNEEEFDALKEPRRGDRIEKALDLYQRKFDSLANTTHPPPNIVMVPLSKHLVQECKDPRYKIDKILYQRRSEAAKVTSDEPFDFHHVLKVLSFKHKLTCQVILPRTITFSSGLQDAATIAWNFAAAVYYKGTGTPWKLADVDDRTLLVGISFYREPTQDGFTMRASMAHVYIKSAESQIIRGKPFRWEETDPRKQPNLTREQAAELLLDVLKVFKDQRRQNPARIVIHKSSPFTAEEMLGFDQVPEEKAQTDYVHIDAVSGIRFFHEGEGYPPVRGTLVTSNPISPALLYTIGFIPSLGTYQGGNVALPLYLDIPRMESSHSQIGRDLLSLSKLDWNTTDFCKSEPVTTSVSRKVGHILAEMRARNLVPPQSYSYYM